MIPLLHIIHMLLGIDLKPLIKQILVFFQYNRDRKAEKETAFKH